uniref:Tc1-like transposase DDE domain-containing protein n=1 Tax=Hippocampus comes TaxID=109280 RepID=A0A3Q2ZDT3_HIPCM
MKFGKKSQTPPSLFYVHCVKVCVFIRAVLSRMEWPALSPDLNPIENMWDQLRRHVEPRNSAPQNLTDLRAALQEEWDAVPQPTISRIVNSMRRRCQAVIDAQGYMTSY